jgi:predicted transposase YdaD
LRLHLSDVLYSLLIDGEPGLIYSILEAETDPKPLMPLRFIRYQISALKSYAELFKGKKLPVIIPILLYTGKRSPYPYETDFFDCFADPELARDTFFTPKLIDLSVTSDNEIMQHGKAAFVELVTKHIRDRDVLNLAYQLAELLKTHPLTRNLFRHMLNYVVDVGESESYDEFLKIIINQTTDD